MIFFVDNNYHNNLYFVQYERILPISCHFFALRALFYLFVKIFLLILVKFQNFNQHVRITTVLLKLHL